jgi:hypothetical protein
MKYQMRVRKIICVIVTQTIRFDSGFLNFILTISIARASVGFLVVAVILLRQPKDYLQQTILPCRCLIRLATMSGPPASWSAWPMYQVAWIVCYVFLARSGGSALLLVGRRTPRTRACA